MRLLPVSLTAGGMAFFLVPYRVSVSLLREIPA